MHIKTNKYTNKQKPLEDKNGKIFKPGGFLTEDQFRK